MDDDITLWFNPHTRRWLVLDQSGRSASERERTPSLGKMLHSTFSAGEARAWANVERFNRRRAQERGAA